MQVSVTLNLRRPAGIYLIPTWLDLTHTRYCPWFGQGKLFVERDSRGNLERDLFFST